MKRRIGNIGLGLSVAGLAATFGLALATQPGGEKINPSAAGWMAMVSVGVCVGGFLVTAIFRRGQHDRDHLPH